MLDVAQDGGMFTEPTDELVRHSRRSTPLDDIDAVDSFDLCDGLLGAFVAMANKSKRRQADLSAALRRSGINATAEQLREALTELQAGGCIRDIVPLYDGGMLMTVTNLGMDRTSRNPHWRFLDKLGPH